jgi:hypothetical protein
MITKTYDHQTAKFLAVVGENMPEISSDVMQKWIENPKALQKVLSVLRLPETATEPKQEPTPLLMSITIDTDCDPKIPSGLFLTGTGTEHRKMGIMTLEKRADGKLYANNKEVIRHLSLNQQNGESIKGYQLRTELKDKQVLNACIMDALLANPHLIPEVWKIGHIYFWGTIFRDAGGSLYVGFLYWSDGGWHWRCIWLAHWLCCVWRGSGPAASLAS